MIADSTPSAAAETCEDTRPMLQEQSQEDMSLRQPRFGRRSHQVLLAVGGAAALFGAAVTLTPASAALRGSPKSEVQLVEERDSLDRFLTVEAADCVRMAGVRLVDGKGGVFASVEGEKKMKNAVDCANACVGKKGCKQAIFAAGAHGCFMFKEATATVAEGAEGFDTQGSPDYHESMYCSMGKKQAEDLKSKVMDAMSKVRKSWGGLEKMWDKDRQRKQDQYDQVQQKWQKAEKRAQKTLDSMEVWEKVNLLHGGEGGNGYAGFLRDWNVEGGISLKMNDGPQGYNNYQSKLAGTSTQLPALLSIAASFNRDTSREYAQVVAEEFVSKGSNVLLGPDVEIVRAPLSGRSFETIAGEDPYLGSELVKPFIQAVQQKGIIATVKHWLDNNEEIYRMTMNVEVDDRSQHEIYMPVFKAAFDAGAGAVMCSYNRVYGTHACENPKLLMELLREDLGFHGYVVSDWGATHDGPKSADAGLDVEMPVAKAFKDLDTDGQADRINQMASRILSSMYASGQLDGVFPEPEWGAMSMDATTDEHREVAKQVIIDSTVLLKNDGATLPVQTDGKRIAMVGKYCNQALEKDYQQGSVYSGGGSGYVETNRVVTPFQGVSDAIQDAKVWQADKPEKAKGADYAVVCATTHAEEGWDRESYDIADVADTLGALRKLNPAMKIVVLAAVPGAVHTDWAKDADAVLMMFMPGEQVGNALADLLTGKASPAGRLPLTMPTSDENRFTAKQYPGECEGHEWCENMTAAFSEGVLIGYRWNDATKKPAAYPFGHGLTYTTFEYTNAQAQCKSEKAVVTLQVRNTGDRDGQAVPQLYVGFNSLKPALRQLRGFRKVQVPKGGTADITFFLGQEDWSYYDKKENKWVTAASKGEKIDVFLGTSSADLFWNATLSC